VVTSESLLATSTMIECGCIAAVMACDGCAISSAAAAVAAIAVTFMRVFI
jgi:hypothetical protein